ncbi:MAG: recombinase family protein [Candidatus Methylomirabilota bacterium]
MKVVLYGRVSTRDQNIDTQIEPLRAYATSRGLEVLAECVDVGVSGRKEKRPGLDQVMALARARTIDTVIVAAFDRFGRSLAHLVRALEEFEHLGVGFISLREQLDLGSPTGRVMFAVIGAMAQFEQELIRERIRAGLARARSQGKRLGRPPQVYHRDRVLPLRQAGHSQRKIAQELGISRRAVQRALKGAQNHRAGFCARQALSQGPPAG